MANAITMQQLIDASLDTDALEIAINGADNQDVQTRLNKTYPTLAKAIKTIMSKAPIDSTPFATKSAMQADTTLADNAFAYVFNDSTLDNNGLYQKVGGAWSKTKIRPLAYDTHSVNILDMSNKLDSHYIDFSAGNTPVLNGYSVTDYLPVEPNTTYKVSDFYGDQFAFFDKSKNYVSGMPRADSNHEFTTPSNAAYARFTIQNEQADKIVIAKKSEFPSKYQPFSLKKIIKDLQFTDEQAATMTQAFISNFGGERVNILDMSNKLDGHYIGWGDATTPQLSGYLVTDYLPIEPNTTYKVSDFYGDQFAFFDSSKKHIGGMASADINHEFTTPSNAAYARFTIQDAHENKLVIAKKSLFSKDYIDPSKLYFADIYIPTDEFKTTEIWVSADTSDTDTQVKFKGNNAIQLALDSITDASATNRYVIRVKQGLYKITKATDFLGYRGYPAMVCTKDHVDIIGQGIDNTIVSAELPYDDAQIGASVDGNTYPRSSYQTVYDYADDSKLEGITFIAKNLRYAIHIDDRRGANKSRNYDNVAFIFKGNKGNLDAMGCGTSSGETTKIVGGRSLSDTSCSFSSHSNTAFSKPSSWSFENHEFIALSQRYTINMQNSGSLVQDKLELIGSSFGGVGYAINYIDPWLTADTSKNYDNFNHAEWQITGYGNEPFLFDNTIANGACLRIKSKSVGANSTVRFDKNSSAYQVLIKNNRNYAQLYTNNYDYIDGYIVQDGSTGLRGTAFGCLDLSDAKYWYDSINYTSLAKRLGNLSSNTKTLVVIVDGVTNTISFNKDYSNMSNAQILADINAQLSNATADLYIYGRDYYPTITDVTERVYNNGSTYIAKGSLVTKQGGFVRLANANDKVFGVALDDIPVVYSTSEGVKKGEGRVLKRGYISTDRSKAHFVLADNQSPAIGTRFAVNNGQLVTDSNGKISVDIDVGVISINC